MYTKCLYTKCIAHCDKLLYTFCIQNLAGIVLLILYTKCIRKLVKMWYTFCTHSVYILYTSVVYILYNFCIQNVYTVSVSEGFLGAHTGQTVSKHVWVRWCKLQNQIISESHWYSETVKQRSFFIHTIGNITSAGTMKASFSINL